MHSPTSQFWAWNFSEVMEIDRKLEIEIFLRPFLSVNNWAGHIYLLFKIYF